MTGIADLQALDDAGCAVSPRPEETHREETETGPPVMKIA
jgi:hypothetical protein